MHQASPFPEKFRGDPRGGTTAAARKPRGQARATAAEPPLQTRSTAARSRTIPPRALSPAPMVIDGLFLERTVHLLRNHLAALQAASHLLIRHGAGDDSPGFRWRAALLESAAGMARLLGQLEKLGQMLGPAPAPSYAVPLRNWIRTRVRETQAAEPAACRRVAIGSAPAGTWRFPVVPASVALDSLLGNALLHPKAGSRATVAARVAPGGLVVTVTDSGAGIPASEVPRLFTPFFRGKASRDVPGAGLGLALAQAAATRAGGGVRLGNGGTRGARFELFLRATCITRPSGTAKAARGKTGRPQA